MEKIYLYETAGVCAGKILIAVSDDTISSVRFLGGCSGNAQGVAALVVGQKLEEVVGKIKDIRCGNRTTSCPDQLATALMQIESGELAEYVPEEEQS